MISIHPNDSTNDKMHAGHFEMSQTKQRSIKNAVPKEYVG